MKKMKLIGMLAVIAAMSLGGVGCSSAPKAGVVVGKHHDPERKFVWRLQSGNAYTTVSEGHWLYVQDSTKTGPVLVSKQKFAAAQVGDEYP